MSIAVKSIWFAATLLAATVASAADLFRLTVTVDTTDTRSQGYTTVDQLYDALTDESLRQFMPTYTSQSATTLMIDYRGMPIAAAYLEEQTTLTFAIDALGISETFEGATRNESRQLLRDYLKQGDTLGRINAYLAEVSPVDPVAGNPASLQTRMVAGRYQQDFTNLVLMLMAKAQGGQVDTPVQTRPAAHSTLQPAVSRYSSDGLSSTTVALPFSHAFDTSPSRPLALDGELQYLDAEGAVTYGGQLGLSYRQAMNERWYLVPGASFGMTGSRDLGTIGSIISASLTSAFRLVDAADFTLWMGNGVNWSSTLETSYGDYHSDPEIRNWAFTNGLVLSVMPGGLLRNQWVELSFTDSRYQGSNLYDERYDEIGIALVHARRSELAGAVMRLELSYLDATNSRGWAARFHISF